MNYNRTDKGIYVKLKDGRTIIIPTPSMLDLEICIALYTGDDTVDGCTGSIVFSSVDVEKDIYDIYVGRYLCRKLKLLPDSFM